MKAAGERPLEEPMKKTLVAVLVSLAAAVAAAQQPAAPARMDHDACMKGSAEMGSAHAKAAARYDAAWKQIEADLAAAKKATGEKKVAALEAVLEKLVALHGEMHRAESAGMTAASMDCCAGEGGSAKASMAAKRMDCCGDGSKCCGSGIACCEHEGSAASAAPSRK
jgi:hypothetical protein